MKRLIGAAFAAISLALACHAAGSEAQAPTFNEYFRNLQLDTAKLLIQGRAYEAKRWLDQAAFDPLLEDHRTDLAKLQALVNAVNDKDRLILTGFIPEKGNEIDVRLVRSTERWTVVAVSSRYLSLSRVEQDEDGKDVTKRFNVRAGDLHYREQMERLAMSREPYAQHVLALLIWQWGQKAEARAILAKLGDDPLAKLFEELMKD